MEGSYAAGNGRLQRKHAEALPIYKKAYEGRCSCLGQTHPSTLHTLGEMAQTTLALHKVQEAVGMLRQCEPLQQRNLATLSSGV